MEGVLPRSFSAVGSGYPVLHKPLRKPSGKPVGVVIRQSGMAIHVFCGKVFSQTEVENDGPPTLLGIHAPGAQEKTHFYLSADMAEGLIRRWVIRR
jgi:hypothetical protein